ncbi:hypothetical protein C8R45DRAFT_1106705 [Mycena sanguinolenta]|nr:hypothetical protein C8R45DRAFT_1106705 [Mycena sanguinolenta]
MPRARRTQPAEGVRRSGRTSRPPTRADEPVSYALPSAIDEEEDEGSTTPRSLPSLIVPLAHTPGTSGTPFWQGDSSDEEGGFVLETERTYLDIDSDTESPLPNYLRERVMLQTFMARVDGLTFQERIDMLIAEIHRIQPPSTNNVARASETMSPTASPAISRPLSPLDGPISLPISRPPTPGDSNISQGDMPIVQALYFVAVQTPQEGRTFVQILPALPGPDHTLIARLSTGMLGRTLGRLDQAHFCIGTTDFAVDVTEDYMHYRFHFRELGPWAEVQEATNPVMSLVTPVLLSSTRENLLQQRQMDHSTPVYAIYIYHEDVQSADNPAAVPPALMAATVATHRNPPSNPAAAPMAWTAANVPTHNNPSSNPAAASAAPTAATVATQPINSGLAQLLRARFQRRFDRIAHAQTAPRLGQAYRHIMQEKNVVAICSTLGIDLSARVFTPVELEGYTVSYDDVLAVAGLVKKTFGTARTAVTKAREARRLLAQLFGMPNGTAAQVALAPAITSRFSRLHQVLSVMLVESDIDERFLDDQSGRAETEALTMQFREFRSDVALVLETLR